MRSLCAVVILWVSVSSCTVISHKRRAPRSKSSFQSLPTAARTDDNGLRVFPKPERLCLGAPYNTCIDVAADPDAVYSQLIKKCPDTGCTVLDIGANRGDFIQTTLKEAPATKIIGFEPHPTMAASLQERFGNEENVIIYNAGLSVAPGMLSASVSFGSGYQAVRFLKNCNDLTDRDRKAYNKTCHKIPTIALDDIVDFPVNIMKVDVQGHELDVLLGGFATFMRGFDIILSELSPSLFESEAHARLYLKLLASQGYHIYPLQQLTPKFKKKEVKLPAEGIEIDLWKAVYGLRRTGGWMDLLCVRKGLQQSQ